MMSPFTSMFSGSTTGSRIEAMKAAEKALISFSHRFSWENDEEEGRHNNDNHHETNPKYNKNTATTPSISRRRYDIQLLDTPIPRAVIPLKNEGQQHACQLFPSFSSSSCKSKCAFTHEEDGASRTSLEQEQQNLPKIEEDSSQQQDQLIIHGVRVTRQRNHYDHHGISNDHQDHPNNNQKENDAPLVLLHGYMNGALYFYRNLIGLADHCSSVYSLDMLGWGLSSRPPFQMDKTHPLYNYIPTDLPSNSSNNYNNDFNKKRNDKLHQKRNEHKSYATHATEQVFVESLEAWRKENNISKMNLAGHSMGGYMIAAYAEKYPERIQNLIFISPAGVPDDEDVDVHGRFQNAGIVTKTMIAFFRGLFNYGITPAAFLRNLPESRARNMVAQYIRGRLPAIQSIEEQEVLAEYLYTNAVLPSSGEDCLNKVLKPTAFARIPLLHRIPFLKVDKISFIYGQHDWMDPSAGVEVMDIVQQLNNDKEKTSMGRSKEERTTPKIDVYGVKNAGHLLMLENWEEFNAAMIMALGRGKRLPSHVSKPYKVLGNRTDGRLQNGAFFVKSRWNRKKKDDDGEEGSNEINQPSGGEASPSIQ